MLHQKETESNISTSHKDLSLVTKRLVLISWIPTLEIQCWVFEMNHKYWLWYEDRETGLVILMLKCWNTPWEERMMSQKKEHFAMSICCYWWLVVFFVLNCKFSTFNWVEVERIDINEFFSHPLGSYSSNSLCFLIITLLCILLCPWKGRPLQLGFSWVSWNNSHLVAPLVKVLSSFERRRMKPPSVFGWRRKIFHIYFGFSYVKLTSFTSYPGYESDGISSRPTVREQLANLVQDRDDDFTIPLGKNLKKVTAKFLTISQKRNIRRQSYLNEVSQRNDSVFFATIGAFVILPPIIILGIAIATGYVQLFP